MEITYTEFFGILIGMHVAWICAYQAFFNGDRKLALVRELWAVAAVGGMTVVTISASTIIQHLLKFYWTIIPDMITGHGSGVAFLASIFSLMVFFFHPFIVMGLIKYLCSITER